MKTNRVAVAALIAAVAAPAAFAKEAVQWRVEDGGNGHWYRAVDTGANSGFPGALAQAIAAGGDLVSMTSQSESDFVTSTLLPTIPCNTGSGDAWIGLYQDTSAPDYSEPAGGWRWTSGEPVTFTQWAGGGPSNSGPENWAAMYKCYYFGRWNDVGEMSTMRYSLLEWSADCNGDGIVDYGQILDGTFEDANANGVPDCCDEGVSCDPCVGDVNFDGIVNGADISVLLGFWGLNGKPVAADINKDGQVDGADLANVLGNWGSCE